jgi:hypothetical protein
VTFAEDLSGQLINCIFEDNLSVSHGGGVLVIGGMIQIIDCLFVGNQAAAGGGACLQNTVPHVERCTFQGNLAGMGGGLHLYAPYGGILQESTFHRNRADQGGAASVTGIPSVYPFNISSCIFAGSTFGEGLFWDGNNELGVASCDIFGNTHGDWVGPIADFLFERFNFQLDPLFCDDATGDFTLAANSPCLAENSPGGVQVGAWGQGCGFSGMGELPASEMAINCYPNPFNPVVNIRFSLARSQDVQVEVFDLSGRIIAKLAGASLEEGAMSLAWTGLDLRGKAVPSGSYLVRVQTEEGSGYKKVLLLR